MPRPRVPFSKRDPARASYDEQNDRYYRQEGACRTKTGNLSTMKFYLGSDEVAARERALKLHELWGERVAKGESEWTPEIVLVARAIATGATHFTPEIPPELVGLHRKEYCDGKQVWQDEGTYRRKFRTSVIPVLGPGQTQKGLLYDAIEQCAKQVLINKQKAGETTEYGKRLSEQIKRLKASHANIPLNQFTLNKIEEIVAYWKKRPASKKSKRPVAPSTVKNELTALRFFLRWLHRSQDFDWTKPDDWDDVTRYNKNDLLTAAEIAALADEIPVYSVSELAVAYKYATDYEKLFVLLALNCGFAQSEITSLRVNELFFDDETPAVKRIRIKNQVYGRVALWAETISGLKWHLHQCPSKQNEKVLLSARGKPLTRQRIANMWDSLMRRITKDHPKFRKLGFKYLRKTAAQFMQSVGGEVVAGVFLFHGAKVRADDLLDKYTNRDWAAVYRANLAVRQMLQPMFDQCPEPFRSGKQKGGGNISLGKIERIQQLHHDGVPVDEIAQIVKVSRATVYRRIQGMATALGENMVASGD